jgi:hypothetical protein
MLNKENTIMRLTTLIAGAALALAATACVTHRTESATRSPPAWEYGNPNYANTGAGGDSDMGSAGGETYDSTHGSRTMQGTVPTVEEAEYYEAAKNPKDAGAGGGKDAGTY